MSRIKWSASVAVLQFKLKIVHLQEMISILRSALRKGPYFLAIGQVLKKFNIFSEHTAEFAAINRISFSKCNLKAGHIDVDVRYFNYEPWPDTEISGKMVPTSFMRMQIGTIAIKRAADRITLPAD